MEDTQEQQPVPKPSQETESLLKRLAGPSSGKAGLAKDQTEINRIISEASKGSKFYENEKKKDRELTARIEKTLKQRDEVVKGVDIHKIEATVDHLIEQLESDRDLTQIIVHVDMDAFYASVELLDNPSLQGKTFAVGFGVLTTASYEARKYGVRSGMAGNLRQFPIEFAIQAAETYPGFKASSQKSFVRILSCFQTDFRAGCDEGYLNITSYCEEHSLTAEECVKHMRDAVFNETKLTVSAGIAPNKMLAKICSDKNKPNGQFQLDFDAHAIKAFMHDLSIRKVPGIGRVNERLLDAIGIKTCGDIYTQRGILSLMDKQFGLVFLLRCYLGISSNVVRAWQREERKSIGAERTFAPLDEVEKILAKLDEVSVELEKDMENDGWTGRTITLKYKLDTYQVFTRAKSMDKWVSSKEELFAIGKELLMPEFPLKLRLIGLRVTKLKDLRAPDPANGIKRFFESVKDAPRKKAKLEEPDHDVREDSMPGFHEDDEADYAMHEDHDEIELLELPETSVKPLSVSKQKPKQSKVQLSPSKQAESSSSTKGKDRQRSQTRSPIKPKTAAPEEHSGRHIGSSETGRCERKDTRAQENLYGMEETGVA
ncbi:hypothetical protein CVT24_003426 [Panaeolus cyanescens]|uniref:DNA polymerase kappa n=1 Tax=Panaeolus cyanescens TaxID=181874 RepID=A0A409Y6Z1_9AGAR|nr:hypothetical protein CVT24_003426 [Panaeolus cyanescens]